MQNDKLVFFGSLYIFYQNMPRLVDIGLTDLPKSRWVHSVPTHLLHPCAVHRHVERSENLEGRVIRGAKIWGDEQ